MWSTRSLLLLVLAFVASTQVTRRLRVPATPAERPYHRSASVRERAPAAFLSQAFLLQTAGHLGLHSAASCAASRVESCPCMRCRTNLKKEKRLRNRINAFRFKKGGFGPRRRFSPVDHAAIQKKADEDNQFSSMVRRASAHRACPPQGRPPHSANGVLGVPAGVHLHRGGGGGRIGGGEEEPAREEGGGGGAS